jgi:signal transduction histidine kinase
MTTVVVAVVAGTTTTMTGTMTTMTVAGTTTTDSLAFAATSPPTLSRWRRSLSTARTRILAWYVGLIGLALLASLIMVRQVLLARLDEQVNDELVQEVEELRTLVRDGRDPETSEPFGSVQRLLEVFVSRNIPSPDETMLTFVGGRGFQRSARPPPAPLHTDAALMQRLGATTEPTRGSVMTEVGRVDYAAMPVRASLAGAPQDERGVFVVALFRDLQVREVDEVARVFISVGFATLLLASLVAWVAAGRILAPVRLVTDTARSISETDLSKRIPVHGDDEVSRLSATFNEMLDRLQNAFATQRYFIVDAGHELRTPITIVRGHLELLGDDPDERAETVAIVTDELDRMSRMVDDLLMLAKAERHDFLHTETVDLAALTDDLFAKASTLGARNWKQEARGEGLVVADPQRLTQAVMQLAQNATQHTEAGDTITLGSEVRYGEARLWVRDTGDGVAAVDRDRIFDRFARSTGSRRVSEGAGLGLSIVRAIAQAHHGRVELASAPGEGATFTLTFPVDPPSEEE